MASNNIVNAENLQRPLYKISLQFIDNNILEEVPDFCIKNLSIENRYLDNFLPKVSIKLVLTKRLYKLLLKHKNTIKFRLKLESYSRMSINGDLIRNSNNTLIFDNLFQPFFEGLDTDNREELSTDKTNNNEPSMYMEIYLFDISALDNNKKIFNFIANDCKTKDVLGYLFNQAGMKNVIMAMPQYKNKFSQIICPPLNFKNTIQNVSDTYGIFKNGIRQYYDLDMYYLLTNDLSSIPVKYNDYENVFINVTQLNNENSIVEGFIKDTNNKCYIMNTINQININNQGSNIKEINGNVLRIYDRTNVESAVKYDEKTGKFNFKKGYTETKLKVDGYNGSDKVQYIYNTSENQSNVNNYIHDSESSNIEFSMTMNTIDLNIMKPNRRYIFRFENTEFARKYNGEYILNDLIYSISQSTGEIQGVSSFKFIK